MSEAPEIVLTVTGPTVRFRCLTCNEVDQYHGLGDPKLMPCGCGSVMMPGLYPEVLKALGAELVP